MRIFVVNSGSSSLKLRLLDDTERVVASAELGAVDQLTEAEVEAAIATMGAFDAVGHRVVHGGRRYLEPARIDAPLRSGLEALTPLAPRHQPAALRAIDIVTALAPEVRSVACFDTAFHATLPAVATTYAIPRRWREALGVRKYGFHGLAHAWTSRRASELLGTTNEPARIVTCHLGAGASLAAVVGGQCVDTTMGFTPLDGLVMATRSGSIDPGLVLWLQIQAGLTAEEVSRALERESGLAGLAGTSDMRAVLERAEAGHDEAELAVGVYVYRLVAGIVAMVAAAGGLDALVFSGGIGERAAPIRQRVAAGLGFLDVTVNTPRNVDADPDCEITGDGRVRVFVIAAREDVEIAHAVRSVLRNEQR